jgi:hypothetical protein
MNVVRWTRSCGPVGNRVRIDAKRGGRSKRTRTPHAPCARNVKSKPQAPKMLQLMSSECVTIHGASCRYKTMLALRWARQDAKIHQVCACMRRNVACVLQQERTCNGRVVEG